MCQVYETGVWQRAQDREEESKLPGAQGVGREVGGPMQLERQGGPDIPTLISCEGMTDSEKNDFINFIYGQLKEREAQNETLHAKLDAQMDRFDKLQATLDAISSQLAESNKMKEVLQKGFDNMHAQLDQMKNELVKTQKELRKSQREAKKYRELYEVLRDEKFVTKSQKSNALNYFDNSWKQVMAWRNDGRYTIDRSALPLGSSKNSEAERNIRTMTIERSNSKSFGSNEGVESSAVYHTIIATCKAQAISVCDYLKKFFMACVDGRTDYENLTPMMLCQPVK